MAEQPQDPAKQQTEEEFDAEATQAAKQMVEGAKPTKTKQEVIDQVGRITNKLADRVDKLETMQKQHVPLRHNGNVTATVFENIGQELRTGQVGDTELSTNRLNGRTTVVAKTVSPDGSPMKDEAWADKKSSIHYGYKTNPDGYQNFGTKTMNTDTYDQQSVHGYTRKKKDLEPDWPYDKKYDEMHTYTEELGYRSDTDFLGSKNDDKDTPQELIDRAVSQSAETLGSIRGTVAAAEIAQQQAEQSQPGPEESQPPVQNVA